MECKANQLVQMERYAEEHYVPIIKKDSARYIRALFSEQKPEKILEIGTAIGYSALLFYLFTNKQAKIETIEIDEDMVYKARANIEAFGAERHIHVVPGDAADVLRCFADAGKQYDFIFMDAAKGQYIEFFPYCLRMLREGGVLVSDNVLYREMILGQKGCDIDVLKECDIHVPKERDIGVPRKVITLVRKLRQYIDIVTNHPELETEILQIGDGMAVSKKRKKMGYL